MKRKFVLFIIGIILSNSIFSNDLNFVDKIKISEAKVELDYFKTLEKNSEMGVFETILVNNFFSEYYYKLDRNEKLLKDYVDRTIGMINRNVENNSKINEKAEMYAILSDNYSKKIDGFFTAIEYGKKAQEAIEKAMKIDMENQRVKYVRAKIYMSAPPIAGGDTQKSQKVFEDLVKIDGNNSFYYTYLGIVRGINGNKNGAKEAFKRAYEISNNNKFAESEMKR